MEKDNRPSLAVSVRSGRHAGARQTIFLPTFSIGSSFASDVVLTDPSVASCHVRISARDKGVQVEAIASPSFLGGTELILNAATETALPSRLRVGEIEIDIHHAASARRHGAWLPMSLLGLATVLILGGGASLALQKDAFLARVLASKSETAPDRPALADQQSVLASKEQVQAAANALEERLAAANIATIKLATRTGMVTARGTVTSASKANWNALQIWFDETYGRGMVLQAEVAISNPVAPEPPIAIQSVWSGKQPYLIDGQGNKHFEGVVLKDGWIIERIEPEKVTLIRDLQRMVLTF